MKTRLIVFPVLGKRWAFNTLPDVAPTTTFSSSSSSSSASVAPVSVGLRHLWESLLTARKLGDKAEVLTHFVANKMHEKWIALEASPEGSISHRVHSVGNRLLARVEPSEFFLKSIPRDATSVEILFPVSIKPRLVRRRVRHLAIRGAQFHRRFLYGSVALLPFSALLGVLPLPNVVLFWNIFRAHAHWRALKGGERLRRLVSNSPDEEAPGLVEKGSQAVNSSTWVLLPSKKLEQLVTPAITRLEALSDAKISEVCKEYHFDSSQIIKWRDYKFRS